MIDRMLFAEAMETQKCFDEGVITTTADANIGSIMGIGFPPWTGGAAQFIVGYPGGKAGFVARAKELAARVRRPLQPAEVAARLANTSRESPRNSGVSGTFAISEPRLRAFIADGFRCNSSPASLTAWPGRNSNLMQVWPVITARPRLGWRRAARRSDDVADLVLGQCGGQIGGHDWTSSS